MRKHSKKNTWLKAGKCFILVIITIIYLVLSPPFLCNLWLEESSPDITFLWGSWAQSQSSLIFFAFGHLRERSAVLFCFDVCCCGVVWFHLCACVTKSCSEPLTCEHQPLISSSSKVTRLPRRRARCHNTPSFSLSSLSGALWSAH